MIYRSIAQLNTTIRNGLWLIPEDIDLVVGIPRSGMLAASMLALHRNVHLTDFEGFLAGRIYTSGSTNHLEPAHDLLHKPCKVLVMEDVIKTGNSLREAKQAVESCGLPHDVLYAAVYVSAKCKSDVDIYMEILPRFQVFEWNLSGAWVLPKACFDLDGVLCRDPRYSEDDDGEKYLDFIRNVSPLLIPTKPVGWIVTARLEKYRAETEQWLARHGVRYGELVMLDLPDKATRQDKDCIADFKASFYRSVDAELFVESSAAQAKVIARISGKHVLCTETGEMAQASLGAECRMHVRETRDFMLYKTVRFAKRWDHLVPAYRIARRLFGRSRRFPEPK